MSHSRHASSSSYNPVLINPHSHYQGQTRSSSHSRPPSLKIKYPFPLFLLSILDLFLTLYNSGNPSVLVGFCTSRFVVLGLVVGFSRHWRDRGGYVALVDGFSVGYVVWTTCKRQLERGKTGPEDGDSQHKYMILALTVLMSFIEYFTFLLLLRLSPPPHKSNPLALRLPNSTTVQTAQPFDYHTSSTTSLTNPTTPSNSKTRHYRHSSKTSLLHPPTAYSEYTDSATDSMTEDEDEEDDDEGVDSDYSSISESSIIDLPPPLTPSRILPQRLNANVNRGLEVLGVVSESAEAIGAVVRRSRSARFLRRSFGSGSRIEDEDDQDDREARGRYGTFGIDDQSTR